VKENEYTANIKNLIDERDKLKLHISSLDSKIISLEWKIGDLELQTAKDKNDTQTSNAANQMKATAMENLLTQNSELQARVAELAAELSIRKANEEKLTSELISTKVDVATFGTAVDIEKKRVAQLKKALNDNRNSNTSRDNSNSTDSGFTSKIKPSLIIGKLKHMAHIDK
jgi:predicted  nucleic acid-binding Zn-ribbon protein